MLQRLCPDNCPDLFLHVTSCYDEVMEVTLSHNKRLEMEDYPSLSESTKAERKKKKQMNKVKSSSFNSAGMSTRAQKGTSKAALADTK